ncbi:MAG: YgfZ/GcvT domain-containing protein, partial [Persicimonas sp.]
MSRTEQVKKRLDGVGAEWTTWLEADVVAHFGDADAEYRAVRDGGAGLVDWSVRDTLVLSGPDAIPWFQGLVTSDLMELREEGAGQLTAVVNRIGRFIAEARALHMPEVLVLDLEPNLVGRGLITHLRRHVITEDVTIENRSETTARLHLAGEAAASVLDDLCETHRPVAELDAYHGTWGELGSEGVVIQRVDWTGEPGFDVSCASDAAHRIFNALYGRDEVEPVGFEPLETMRIEAGMPRFGAELNDAYIPLESGLDHAISFDKGCYLGQEIIARLDSRGTPARKLRALVF